MESGHATLENMVKEALLLDRQNRVSESIAAYQRVLARWPGLVDCWSRFAVLQRKTRQFAGVLRSYEMVLALALNPTYLPALMNLANLHEDMGRRD